MSKTSNIPKVKVKTFKERNVTGGLLSILVSFEATVGDHKFILPWPVPIPLGVNFEQELNFFRNKFIASAKQKYQLIKKK